MTQTRLSDGDIPERDVGLRHLWATDVAFASVEVDEMLLVNPEPISRSFTRFEAQDLLRAPSAVASLFEQAAAVIDPTPTMSVRLHVERWNAGFEDPMVTTSADYFGWLFLHGDVAAHSDAGTVAILDPRCGSNMVAVPGIPWGRPLVLAPKPGTLVVAPSWLTAAVLPLDPGQQVLVVRAEITRSARVHQPT